VPEVSFYLRLSTVRLLALGFEARDLSWAS
jgi:hypothetical protein